MRLQRVRHDWATEPNWIIETAWAIFKWKIRTWFWHGHLVPKSSSDVPTCISPQVWNEEFRIIILSLSALCWVPSSAPQLGTEPGRRPRPPTLLPVTVRNLPRSEHMLTPRQFRRFLLKGSYVVLELLWIREELSHGCPPIHGASSSHRRSNFSQGGPTWGPLVS